MSIRNLLPLAALLGALLPAQNRQQPSQEQLTKLRAEKLAKPVFQKAPWVMDYDTARAQAKKDGKLLFTYFTRSYAGWGPCDALESGPLSDPEFPKFAKDVVLFLHNTSRVDDEPYPKLLQEKGFGGFPSLCFMDADGNVLTKPAQRTVASFAATHASTKALTALKAKGDKATPAERRELFLAELKLGLIKAADIQARADAVALTDADKALVAGKLVDAEIAEVMAGARTAGPEKTAEALVAIHKSGRKPSADVASTYWIQLLNHAARHKDGKLADEAYAALEAKLGKDKNAQRAIDGWKKLRDDAHAK